MERVPVSQECQSTIEIEFNWPVGSHPLEAVPVAGRRDALFGLVRCTLLEAVEGVSTLQLGLRWVCPEGL